MVRRRIRTRDELPRARTRADRAKARLNLGIDLASSADRTGIALSSMDPDTQVTRIHGIEILESPYVPDGQLLMLNHDALTEETKRLMRGFDFRARFDD